MTADFAKRLGNSQLERTFTTGLTVLFSAYMLYFRPSAPCKRSAGLSKFTSKLWLSAVFCVIWVMVLPLYGGTTVMPPS